MIGRRPMLQGAMGVLAAARAALAQPPGRRPRIGFLSIGAPIGAPTNPIGAGLNAAFVEGLRDLGYVEGRSMTIEWRFAEFKPERLPALATDLVRLGVDIIVVGGPAGIQAARDATREIPVVMVASSADPVREGLVASLARPGGNVTGLSAAVSPPGRGWREWSTAEKGHCVAYPPRRWRRGRRRARGTGCGGGDTERWLGPPTFGRAEGAEDRGPGRCEHRARKRAFVEQAVVGSLSRAIPRAHAASALLGDS